MHVLVLNLLHSYYVKKDYFSVVVHNLLLTDLSMWILIHQVLVNIVKDFNAIVSLVEWSDVFVGTL